MPRDTQRSKVYKAERSAFGKDGEQPCITLAEAQRLVDKWGQSKRLQARWPRAAERCEVKPGRGCNYKPEHMWLARTFEHRPASISLARWGRTKWVLAHEYAHHLTHADGRAGHGWEFAEAYLYLVRVVIGKSAEERLRAEFKASRVRYRKPVKRPMTEAQREAARRRMIALNERRALTV